ncbi:portal protein [Microbacterium phage Huwbert]|nr:portal protein [Microbacterium phage Huwbert]
MDDESQWSTTKPYRGTTTAAMTWMDEEHRNRIASYIKYDEMYWNDPRQFELRVLEGESPVYVPNARTVVNTTAHFLLKGLDISCDNEATKKRLDEFLKRELFYSRFNDAKLSGVTRGDFIYHMTADPTKPAGSRISMVPVEPHNVFPIWDEDLPGKMVGVHLATPYTLSKDKDPEQKTRLHRLTYRVVEQKDGTKRISREEGIYVIEDSSLLGFTDSIKVKKIRTIKKLGLLDQRITAIPIYWFKNQSWGGDDYGSSELRGIERITEVVSQSSTDVTGALSLEGLGVYATDGGRPVYEKTDGSIEEGEWEVSPGKVMEVPSGAYFRRVDGVGSVTPAMDQIKYLEGSMHSALGLSDVALGNVDAQVAQSGIALAIKFMPTLARLESRDQAGLDLLTHMFYDWKTWMAVFEQVPLEGDIVPVIGDKLPMDRTAKINELNNMIDRKTIPRSFYRSEMEKLGYKFPADIEAQLEKEAADAFELQMQNMIAAAKAQAGSNPDNGETTLPDKGNQSNNRNRPNESGGTEANNKG